MFSASVCNHEKKLKKSNSIIDFPKID